MKKFLKILGLILGILILLLGSVLVYLRYEFRYKRTEITKSTAGSETAGEGIAKEVIQESKDYYMTLEPDSSFQTDELGTNVGSAVEKALQNLEVGRLLPDGKAAYVGDGEAFENSMAFLDIDMDGQKELLLNIGGTCMADMGFYVYQFDESLDDMYKFRQELVVWPSATFYTNGIVIAELSHNHGYSANDEFWPYHIYDYSSETDEYVKLWEVDAWEKRLRETDHQGVKFPDSIDIDGDGMVYRIYVEETGELMLMDSADYKEWVSEQIKDGEEIEILWREIP